jgi:conjugal transfer mating pair stabilization protein TraN
MRKRLVAWLTTFAFLFVQTAALAQSHEQGIAAGRAANPVIRGMVNGPNASTVVPGYTTTPPETAYAGRPALASEANARLAACALTPADPTCQALMTAITSATTPRPMVNASDPAVAAASHIACNPATALGDLSTYYAGCASPGACPGNVFCLGTSCFNTTHINDPDFARSMSLLEAAREAGVYLDTEQMQVFNGEASRCRDRMFTNCCFTDGAGAGMSNQSVLGVGSRLVYDTLMNSGNREFLYQGLQALVTSGGFSGAFTSYGVTIAVNGTALPAGSAVLYAGESMVIAFDPWSLAIAAVIYVVMSLSSCDAQEGTLAMRRGAGLCHEIGEYCSSRVLGKCTTRSHTHCCFNSMLSRIINEQGRTQVGKGWGSARSPDCSGFTVAQLQSLNFAAMDLSEFYASLIPASPDLAALKANSADRVPSCYFGKGRCQ